MQSKERLQLVCMCSYHGNGVWSMVRAQLHAVLVSNVYFSNTQVEMLTHFEPEIVLFFFEWYICVSLY